MGKDVTNVLQPYYKYFMNESEKLKMKSPLTLAGTLKSTAVYF